MSDLRAIAARYRVDVCRDPLGTEYWAHHGAKTMHEFMLAVCDWTNALAFECAGCGRLLPRTERVMWEDSGRAWCYTCAQNDLDSAEAQPPPEPPMALAQTLLEVDALEREILAERERGLAGELAF